MTTLLEEMIEAVERIKREYPDPPVRFEFATDVWEKLVEAVEVRHDFVSNVLTGKVWPPGIPCVLDPLSGPGEWGPVFRSRG